MAMLVYLHKEEDTPERLRYRFHSDGGADRYLVLDKQADTILPDDGRPDAVFQAAARKLARAWQGGEAPERLVYQA